VNVGANEYTNPTFEALAILSFTLSSTAPDCPGPQFRFWLQHACGSGSVLIGTTKSSASTRGQPNALSSVCTTLLCAPLIPASGTAWLPDQPCTTGAVSVWTVIGKAWSRAPLWTVYSCITARIVFALPRV
jgi:hypothetical protein